MLVILGWTILSGSMREQRYRIAAAALLTGCACSLFSAALLLDPRYPAWVWAAGATTAIAAAVAVRAVRRARITLEIAVDNDGAIRVRDGGVAGEQPCRCAFVAPWLITLRCGTMWVPIWPDSVPESAFRRLHACARWSVGAESRAVDKSENHEPAG